jgi:hypothetical protein
VGSLLFVLKEELAHVKNGSLLKVYTEMLCDKKVTKREIKLIGNLVITREIRKLDRITEIKDCFPIDITVLKEKVINPEAEILLRLNSFTFEIGEDMTTFKGELELNNVKEDVKDPVFYD